MTQPRKTLQSILSRTSDRPERDAVLKSIEGQEVTITAVDIDPEHQGKYRKYPLTTVTLDDGRTFSVAGSAVATPLSQLQPEDFPIGAVFYQEESTYQEGSTFWAVR